MEHGVELILHALRAPIGPGRQLTIEVVIAPGADDCPASQCKAWNRPRGHVGLQSSQIRRHGARKKSS